MHIRPEYNWIHEVFCGRRVSLHCWLVVLQTQHHLLQLMICAFPTLSLKNMRLGVLQVIHRRMLHIVYKRSMFKLIGIFSKNSQLSVINVDTISFKYVFEWQLLLKPFMCLRKEIVRSVGFWIMLFLLPFKVPVHS